MPIKLSPSTLNLFRECPRCFYLHTKEKIYRPSGPFSSLPSGIDLFLKDYFDYFRGKVALPPVIDELELPGKIIPDQKLINQWRKGEGLEIKDKKSGIILYGKLDEAIIIDNKYYVPVDFKTRGFPPQEVHQSHKLQMDVYCWLLKETGYPIKDLAYLIYFYPNRGALEFSKETLPFKVAVEELETHSQNAKKVFLEAIKCLENRLPDYNSDCAFCQWNRQPVKQGELRF